MRRQRSEAEIQAMLDELDAPQPQPQPEPTTESDAVQAMQQLLLKHEKSDLHRVEDPDLARCLSELRTLAHSNIIDVFQSEQVMEYIGVDDNGKDVYNTRQQMSVKDLNTLPRELTACIQQIDIKPTPDGDIIRIRMYDKQIALDKLLRFHGAYKRDNEQQANDQNHGVMDLLLSAIGSDGLPTIQDNSA